MAKRNRIKALEDMTMDQLKYMLGRTGYGVKSKHIRAELNKRKQVVKMLLGKL